MSQENVELARRGYAALNEAYKSGDVNDLLPLAEEMWDRHRAENGGIIRG